MECNTLPVYIGMYVCIHFLLKFAVLICKRIWSRVFPVSRRETLRSQVAVRAMHWGTCLAGMDLGHQRKRNYPSGTIQHNRIAGVARLSSSHNLYHRGSVRHAVKITCFVQIRSERGHWSLATPSRRYENIIKKDLKERECRGVGWCGS